MFEDDFEANTENADSQTEKTILKRPHEEILLDEGFLSNRALIERLEKIVCRIVEEAISIGVQDVMFRAVFQKELSEKVMYGILRQEGVFDEDAIGRSYENVILGLKSQPFNDVLREDVVRALSVSTKSMRARLYGSFIFEEGGL